MNRAAAARTLPFSEPAATFSSPFVIASKPCAAARPSARVSAMSAPAKNFVSVGPGISEVTVTPVSFSSAAGGPIAPAGGEVDPDAATATR
ncbi:hypothetical protein ACPFP2_02230 [Micromonospora citrea]|uniref:hypothetical protein n=1 Tax=Micromonospora citrea TaxID=47855 RepID=UPI003C47E5FA